jgi:DNA-binding response OmpR family regulator
MKLLLVEDDIHLTQTLQQKLKTDYVVQVAHSLEQAEYFFDINEYDIFIIDINLPDGSGQKLCEYIRHNNNNSPILVLSGKSEVEQRISALDAGADDYLTKPFHYSELVARLRALLRRPTHAYFSATLIVDDLYLDTVKKVATRNSEALKLRPKEFILLEFLMRNKGAVVTRNMILNHLWDDSYEALTNIVDVHIKHLRDRIDRPYPKKLIKTIHGLGYKIGD